MKRRAGLARRTRPDVELPRNLPDSSCLQRYLEASLSFSMSAYAEWLWMDSKFSASTT